jgi:hypothetical protein
VAKTPTQIVSCVGQFGLARDAYNPLGPLGLTGYEEGSDGLNRQAST